MGGDYSRRRFNPAKAFSAVLQQQGRVQLDSDANEAVDILRRRLRAETLDTMRVSDDQQGPARRCVVPRETPGGFSIALDDGMITIGRGRCYVHGLQVDNLTQLPRPATQTEGDSEELPRLDPLLEEEVFDEPIRYDEQPFFPSPPPLPDGGPHLVYLDVWQREVTHVEYPDLIEPAVGVDTTTRLQTVWQVKVLEDSLPGLTCSTGDDQMPDGWQELIRPSEGRLTTRIVPVEDSDDPCPLPPTGGYRGLENRLYRVEIHDGGESNAATFKFSQDNGSVATAVQSRESGNQLRVARVAWGDLRRFSHHDWIEITNDVRELAGEPGEMRQIGVVDDASRTITLLGSALPEDLIGSDDGPGDLPYPEARPARIKRWDQRGSLVNADGVIEIPDDGSPVVLQHGIELTFSTTSESGQFRSGDHWLFAARTADATQFVDDTLERLTSAPPRGTHHHYCRLAVVTFPDGQPSDCRSLWPPDVAHEGCGCTECVTVEDHQNDPDAIQEAVNRVRETGGTVCLGAGTFELGERSINLVEAQSVRIKGQGWRTLLQYVGEQSAISLRNCVGVVLEDLLMITPGTAANQVPDIAIRGGAGNTIQRCYLAQANHPNEGGNPAIGLAGAGAGLVLRDNVIEAAAGVESITSGESTERDPEDVTSVEPLTTDGLEIANNSLFCARRAVGLTGLVVHGGRTTIVANSVEGGRQGGLVVHGVVPPEAALDIRGNVLRVQGPGVVFSTDRTRVEGNNISGMEESDGEELANGISFTRGVVGTQLDNCQLLGNRITDMRGDGISIGARLRSAMIKNNIIHDVGGGGIVLNSSAEADSLSIENNSLQRLGDRPQQAGSSIVAIRAVRVRQLTIGANSIARFSPSVTEAESRFGILVISSTSIGIHGNDLVDIGAEPGSTTGIAVVGTFDRLNVVDNRVLCGNDDPSPPDSSDRLALRVGEPGESESPVPGGDLMFVARSERRAHTIFRDRVVVEPTGSEHILVRGNTLQTFGGSPAVQIAGRGPVLVCDNQIVAAIRGRDTPMVSIDATAAVVSSNYLERSARGPAIDLRIEEPADGQPAITVLGNIMRHGEFFVNGAPVEADNKWLPLNAMF